MIDPLGADLTEEIHTAVTRPSRSLLRRLMEKPIAVVALSFIVLVVLVAIFGPLLAPYDPDTASAADVLGPISPEHPLGTDSAGRDVLSRLLYATRFSVAGAAVALVVAAILGVTSGLIAGYYGKWFEGVSGWAVGLVQAMPGIVVLLAARAVLGPSLWTSMAIFGVLLSPALYRLVYATVNAVREELYVDAARVSGLSDSRIISRHILTVVRGPALVQAAFITGVAISIQAGLEFLGLGDLSIPTWGSMLNEGFCQHLHEPGPDGLAEPGDWVDLSFPGSAGQRPARHPWSGVGHAPPTEPAIATCSARDTAGTGRPTRRRQELQRCRAAP